MNEQEFKEAMARLEPAAIAHLERTMRDGGAAGNKAAELVLSYSKGKPAQELSLNAAIGLTVNILRFGDESPDAALLAKDVTPSISCDNVAK
jgi:hypothetical protein